MNNNKIFAEQYVEVVHREKKWYVELVIETINNSKEPVESLRHELGSFNNEDDADEFGESLRLWYDKPIYRYNLM
tara:strand:+ start:904 stop:1128 length:225 start_codon:yes stop_codon:yes gene_type:complete